MTPLEEVEALLKAATSSSQCRTVISRAYYVSFRRLVEVATKLGFDQFARDPAKGRSEASVHRRLFDFMRASDQPVLRRIARSRIEDLFKLRIRADYRFNDVITVGKAEEAVLIATEIDDWLAEAGLG